MKVYRIAGIVANGNVQVLAQTFDIYAEAASHAQVVMSRPNTAYISAVVLETVGVCRRDAPPLVFDDLRSKS